MSKKRRSKGISTFTVLFIVFLVLKLTHNIDWSWWWVTSPLWIPVGLILIAAIVVLIFEIIFEWKTR